jgi:hypothetical protein
MDDLDALAQIVNQAATRGAADAQKAKDVSSRDDRAQQTGEMLFVSVVPRGVATDLRTPRLFLDFGMDEALVHFPWELMHDGEEYLCLKHCFGRFVNSSSAVAGQFETPDSPLGKTVDKISVLVISVPRPDARQPGPGGGVAQVFAPLPGAELETNKILETLAGIEGVEVKLLANADGRMRMCSKP